MRATAAGVLDVGSTSLLSGWLPVAAQIVAVVLLALATGWRTRRWRLACVPLAVGVGVLTAGATYAYVETSGISGDVPAPASLYAWVALSGYAVGVLGLGWPRTRWWRRLASVLSVVAALLCVALALNVWTGYVPTIGSGWDQVTGKPLVGEIDERTALDMRLRGEKPAEGGAIVSISTPDDASGFLHRDELVYLPPAWFTSPPPTLPAVVMIGGQLGTPADWFRAGGVKQVIDDFAAAHHGYAPVFVFPDVAGDFTNDTECVNSSRGNAADHVIGEVIPFVTSHFAVSRDRANWGVAGWSMGGTCAVTLAAKYPDSFGAFLDIDGDAFPNAGESEQDTIDRLFGGDAAAFRSWDPALVMAAHGPYPPMAGWINVSEDTETILRTAAAQAGTDPGPRPYPGNRTTIANYLCRVASSNGIDCSVVSIPGEHDWPSGAKAFTAALPWLAGAVGSPDAPKVPLPGVPPRS